MSLIVTPIVAALCAFLLIVLSFRVMAHRRDKQVSLGDGNDRDLERAIRIQGNFVEYTPMALVAMALAEIGGGNVWLLAVIGAALVAGRVFHAVALLKEPGRLGLRVAGMVLTILALAAAGILCLVNGLLALLS